MLSIDVTREAKVRIKNIAALLSAVSLSVAPVAASAASPLSIAHAAPSYTVSLQDDEGGSNHGGGSTAVILGVLLVVLIGVAAISGNGDGPHSP